MFNYSGKGLFKWLNKNSVSTNILKDFCPSRDVCLQTHCIKCLNTLLSTGPPLQPHPAPRPSCSPHPKLVLWNSTILRHSSFILMWIYFRFLCLKSNYFLIWRTSFSYHPSYLSCGEKNIQTRLQQKFGHLMSDCNSYVKPCMLVMYGLCFYFLFSFSLFLWTCV